MRGLRWIHLRQVRLQGQHPEGLVRAAPEPGNPDGSCPAHRTLQAQVKYDNVTWLQIKSRTGPRASHFCLEA